MTNIIIIIIAATLWGECRGEPIAGQYAVADVIYCRGNGEPEKMAEACLKKYQFSCWNNAKENLNRFMSANYNDQLVIAKNICSKKYQPKMVVDHFHTIDIKPSWAREMKQVRIIGNHVFYKSERKW